MRTLIFIIASLIACACQAERRVVIFTQNNCPYCVAQKTQLKNDTGYKRETFRRRVATHTANIDTNLTAREWAKRLGISKVPCIVLVETDDEPSLKMKLPEGIQPTSTVIDAVTRTWPGRNRDERQRVGNQVGSAKNQTKPRPTPRLVRPRKRSCRFPTPRERRNVPEQPAG